MIGGDNASEQWVGRRLREARRQRDLTLQSVAEQVGISGAHLSRLEKGDRQPSIGVLLELARAYQTSIGELLGEEPTRGYHLVRAGSVRTVESADGPLTTISGLGTSAALQAVRLELTPNVHNGVPVKHLGEEWVYVVSGDLDIDLGGSPVSLHTGDALHFDAVTPHHLANPGTAVAEILIVSTSPTAAHH